MTRWGVVGALGIAGASAGLALAPPVAATGTQAPPAGPPTETVTFDEPGAHTWTVPAGVMYATIDAYGASGGGDQPGLGAHVRGTIPVTGGDTYTVVVAGEGGDPDGRTAGAGGFGGGAPGGTGGRGFPIPGFEHLLPDGPGAGGGGGASDLRSGAADDSGLATRLLVAGGGGGAADVAGGDGGLDGAPGADGGYTPSFPGDEPTTLPGGGGGAGPEGAGVPGGNGTAAWLRDLGGRLFAQEAGHAGGGGGGGLFGGGGGQQAADGGPSYWRFGTSSGGGGGSSLVPDDAACPTVVEDGVHTGDGLVVITFHRGAAPVFTCD
jgi:hypothetical protein